MLVLPLRSSASDELAEALGIAAYLQQLAQRVFVERRVEVQARPDDVVPLRFLVAGALAQNVGVVDLLISRCRWPVALHSRPTPPAGAHVVERLGEDVAGRAASRRDPGSSAA